MKDFEYFVNTEMNIILNNVLNFQHFKHFSYILAGYVCKGWGETNVPVGRLHAQDTAKLYRAVLSGTPRHVGESNTQL